MIIVMQMLKVTYFPYSVKDVEVDLGTFQMKCGQKQRKTIYFESSTLLSYGEAVIGFYQ